MRLDFCALCNARDHTLEHHHFLPRVHGGCDDETNLLTLCSPCHGRAHNIPRPSNLGDLVKAGQAKAQERTSAEYQEIAERRRRQADRAAEAAKELVKAERRRERAELRRELLSERPPSPKKEAAAPSVAPGGVLKPKEAQTRPNHPKKTNDFNGGKTGQKPQKRPPADVWHLYSDERLVIEVTPDSVSGLHQVRLPEGEFIGNVTRCNQAALKWAERRGLKDLRFSAPRQVINAEIINSRDWNEIVSTDGVVSYVSRLTKPVLKI